MKFSLLGLSTALCLGLALPTQAQLPVLVAPERSELPIIKVQATTDDVIVIVASDSRLDGPNMYLIDVNGHRHAMSPQRTLVSMNIEDAFDYANQNGVKSYDDMLNNPEHQKGFDEFLFGGGETTTYKSDEDGNVSATVREYTGGRNKGKYNVSVYDDGHLVASGTARNAKHAERMARRLMRRYIRQKQRAGDRGPISGVVAFPDGSGDDRGAWPDGAPAPLPQDGP